MSSTNANIKNAATELATLQHMITGLKKKANLLDKSLAEYIDKHEVSLANIPRDINSINKVLSRFLEANKIKDLLELVDERSELIVGAMEFTRNPIKGSSRAEYNEAYMTLKTIKNNLDEYKNFGSFENYIKIAQLIIDVDRDYAALMLYTDAPELNLNNIPKTVNDLKNIQLTLGAPLDTSANPEEDINIDSPFDADGRFEIGSEPYLALINKSARESATADITQRKFICYKEAVVVRLEYNNCVTKNQNDSTNLDLSCAPLETRYEISRANCDSHYPMVTVSDLLIADIFNNIEKVHMIADSDGAYIIDQTNSAQAANNYNMVGNTLTIAPPQSIEGIEYNTDFTAINAATKSVSDNAGRILGEVMQSIGCGNLCDEEGFNIPNDTSDPIVKITGETASVDTNILYEETSN